TPEYKKGAFRILNRETLDTMGVNPNVSLAIAMKAGIKVRNGKKGKTFQVAKGNHSTHGYDPSYPSMYTSFIAAGAGIDEHKDIEGMGFKDIVILVEKLLNLNFEKNDEKLIPNILKEKKVKPP